ncbi:MAG: DNA-directed RNA polymerase subunit RPC12/RpoP [Halioglobus sp.]|jgi:DNA-directed RNA polymerase subunit RPC12/RpoP
MIDTESLLKMKRPIFHCPSCDTRILIKPKIAKCGNCNSKFGFYSQTLSENGLCKCPKCNTLNRVKLNS